MAKVTLTIRCSGRTSRLRQRAVESSRTVHLSRPSSVTLVPSTVSTRAYIQYYLSLTASCTELKEKMNAITAGIQGSGWSWLGYNSSTGKLEIVTTANQDPLLCKHPCWSRVVVLL